MIYTSINQPVFQQIPQHAKKILDIGCGSGNLGQAIKQNLTCEVFGITYSEDEANLASQCLDKVIVADINQLDPSILGEFDCIICSHILEHLYNPEKLLIALHNNLSKEGQLIVALPNVLFFAMLCHSFIYQSNLKNKIMFYFEIFKRLVTNPYVSIKALGNSLSIYYQYKTKV